MIDRLTDILDPPEFLRYIVNGLVATAVHYGVLTLNLEVFAMQSAGLANVVAALFGITSSFMGSRYFVFRGHDGALFHQARSFALLYACIAGLHGLVLLAWTDWWGLDYRLGFLLATFLQFLLSYWLNKRLVFKV